MGFWILKHFVDIYFLKYTEVKEILQFLQRFFGQLKKDRNKRFISLN